MDVAYYEVVNINALGSFAIVLTGATFPKPVMAPWPLAKTELRTISVKPPRTTKGASGFLRGYEDAKDGVDTAAAIRVNLPTLPHLANQVRIGHLR